MAILWLIFTTSAISTLVGISLAISHAVFDEHHRLTPHRIIKTEGKMSCDAVVIKAGARAIAFIWGKLLAIFGRTQDPMTYDALSIASSHGGVNERDSLGDVTLNIVASTSSPLPPRGKVSYTLNPNQPSGHADIDRSFAHAQDLPLLKVVSLNVLSGEDALFDTEGLEFALRKGQRITIEGPSGLPRLHIMGSTSLNSVSRPGQDQNAPRHRSAG